MEKDDLEKQVKPLNFKGLRNCKLNIINLDCKCGLAHTTLKIKKLLVKGSFPGTS